MLDIGVQSGARVTHQQMMLRAIVSILEVRQAIFCFFCDSHGCLFVDWGVRCLLQNVKIVHVFLPWLVDVRFEGVEANFIRRGHVF